MNSGVRSFEGQHVASLSDTFVAVPDGPHEVEIASQIDMDKPANQAWSEMVNELSTSGHRAWWFAKDGDWTRKEVGQFTGLEQSLDYIGKMIEQKGSVDAIWGFSQGACFAGMLCALLQDKLADHPLRKHLPANLKSPKVGVIFSGFRARFPQYDGLYEPGIDIPMLHVVGEKDLSVTNERSQALVRVCKFSQFLQHDGGHDLPKSNEDQAQIRDFLTTHLPTDRLPTTQASM